MKGSFYYRDAGNLARVERGQRAVELHPDGLDFEVAASDLIADVLHACNAAPGVDVSYVYALAWKTYASDIEDEPSP